MKINPFLAVDGYKIFQYLMSPEGTSKIYSNFTPRSAKYAPKGCEEVLVFGNQMTMKEIAGNFQTEFFDKPKAEVIAEIKREYDLYTNTDYDMSKIAALHDLGYLPIKVKGLPEGTFVPMGVPVLTIYNTNDEFPWVTNFLETMISNLLWKPMTSATLGYEFKKLNDKWIARTDVGNDFHSQFGCHDFSMRGMDSLFATVSSGLGHAVSFLGSDSLPVIAGARQFYNAEGFVIGSIPATEHSIQCAYYHSEGTDYNYVNTLIERFPTGALGLVADGFDLWKLITEVLPQLKDKIMSRTGGALVLRPDSGDPVDIVCGHSIVRHEGGLVTARGSGDQWIKSFGLGSYSEIKEYKSTPECKGVVELLWDIFGGSINEQGYKVLHPTVRVIYGDAINLERFNEINTRLEAKGFASTNWVAGIGSFTYQFNTRDTFGFAMKSTYQEVTVNKLGGKSITGVDIFKDPITDDGTKKSAKGLLHVQKRNGYLLYDQQSWAQESGGALKTIFQDGVFENEINFDAIRALISK